MVGRLVHTADFKRLLSSPMRSRSAHFAVHHLPALPQRSGASAPRPAPGKLSTDSEPDGHRPVDDSPSQCWLGVVVPKRHARRAVTRSLLKREMRAAVQAHAAALPRGLWLLRLRAPFARDLFPSAASAALRSTARTELAELLQRAQRPAR